MGSATFDQIPPSDRWEIRSGVATYQLRYLAARWVSFPLRRLTLAIVRDIVRGIAMGEKLAVCVTRMLRRFERLSIVDIAELVIDAEGQEHSEMIRAESAEACALLAAEQLETSEKLVSTLRTLRQDDSDRIASLERDLQAEKHGRRVIQRDLKALRDSHGVNPMPRGILTDTEILNATLETLRELSRQIERSSK